MSVRVKEDKKIQNMFYTFRIFPNSIQQEVFLKTFGCVRMLWNNMLADKIDFYKLTRGELKNLPSQYKEKFPFLEEVEPSILMNVHYELEQVFLDFMSNPQKGFPKWKARKHSINSYTTNVKKGENWLTEDTLKLPRVGEVKMRHWGNTLVERPLKSITVSMLPTGEFYVKLFFEEE